MSLKTTLATIIIVIAIVLAVFSTPGKTSGTTTTIRVPPPNQTCPGFYYFNSTTQTCQPQQLSPACPAQQINSPILYLCRGTSVGPSDCPSGYTFNNDRCYLNTTP